MKERPILFKGEMVRAILDGAKTQTRRVCKFTSGGHLKGPRTNKRWHPDDPNAVLACPYGQPGDRLWVKETFFDTNSATTDPRFGIAPRYLYRADYEYREPQRRIIGPHNWKPSIFCTRAASRIVLEIAAVRTERLNDISEADAKAEGAIDPSSDSALGKWMGSPTAKNGLWAQQYALLWQIINGPGSWELNPWIWVITFQRIKP